MDDDDVEKEPVPLASSSTNYKRPQPQILVGHESEPRGKPPPLYQTTPPRFFHTFNDPQVASSSVAMADLQPVNQDEHIEWDMQPPKRDNSKMPVSPSLSSTSSRQSHYPTQPPPPSIIAPPVCIADTPLVANHHDHLYIKHARRQFSHNTLATSQLRDPRYLTELSWQGWLFLLVSIPTGIVLGVLAIVWLAMPTSHQPRTVAKVIAVYCTVMSLVMTLWLVYLHLRSYTVPDQQRPIIRILFMVPIYSGSSLLGFYIYGIAPAYVNLFRDCYEAYLLYNFGILLMAYLGGEQNCIRNLQRVGRMRHPFPLCFLPPMTLNAQFFYLVKKCCIQYMLIHPICNAFAFIFKLTGLYSDGTWSFSDAYPYITAIDNVSITFTATALVYFYKACITELQPHEPFKKFLTVKAIIFLSFWQGIVVNWLISFQIIATKVENNIAQEALGLSLQNFLICVEMLFIAIGFHKAYPHAPYVLSSGLKTKFKESVQHGMKMEDVKKDVQFLLVPWGSRRRAGDIPNYGTMEMQTVHR
eukprot:TRINITY_DN67530_c4_g4_i1.p1 TRINITY_DN67530_c4_g4~~TRINITY_DN67530_c4_g4_i1.p1  ORF type:complete len:528 (+),score=6.82 TRINITY_DN67530_c4_g4_i1:87-1670(+)